MKATDIQTAQHSGGVVGTLGDALSTLRRSWLDYVKLGAGATAAIAGSDLLLSRVLVKDGRPLVSPKWSPLAVAAMGVLGGEFVRRKVDEDVGAGMIAGGVGVALAAVAKMALSAVTRSKTAQATADEAAGQGAQQMEGFGFGRAFAPGFGGGAARLPAQSLYGVGADVSAAGVFNGSTVAIEENGAVAGAAVRIEEDAGGFAGILQ